MIPALEMRGVVKRYRSLRALDGLDLRVPAGSVFGLVGSNGAGKTTSLIAAAGLIRIQAGEIDLLGEGPFSPDRHRGRIALLPQDAQAPGHLRVDELLHFYGRLQGLEDPPLCREVDRVLELVHLTGRRRDKIRALSHGMRRRLTIAQAFLGNPALVLLDEPLNGLDPREVANIRNLFRDRRGNQTLVVSSHLLTELEAVCDHVAIIERGRRVRQDQLHDLTRNNRQLVYHLEPGPAIPMEALRGALPGADLQYAFDGSRLTVRFSDDDLTLAAVNATLVPALLGAGIGVLEIRRGSDLEQEYLGTPTPAA